MTLRYYVPIICEETGYYGGNFSCLAPSVGYAFKLLQIAVRNGLVKRRPYKGVAI